MRRLALRVTSIIVVLSSVTFAQTQGDRANADTAAISGVVVDAIGGAPVPFAQVTLARIGVGTVARVVADSKGRFVFTKLPAAPNYYLSGGKLGFTTTRYGWSRPDESFITSDILQIPLTDGQWVDDIKIPIWPHASISGQVVDERNEPVIGVVVRTYTTKRIAGHLYPVLGPLTQTDDRGHYTINDVTPGDYIVAVPSVQSTVLSTTREEPRGRPVGELAPTGVSGGRGSFVSGPILDAAGTHRLVVTHYATPPPPADGRPRAYGITFYPGVSRPQDAQHISVNYGDARSAIDFQLVPVPAVDVAGHVTGFAGQAPEMLLRLMPVGHEGLGFGAEAATTPLDKDGSFRFLNVPSGDYMLLGQSAVLDLSTASAHIRVDDAPGFPGQRAAVGSVQGIPGIDYLSRGGIPSPVWGRQRVSVGTRDINDLTVAMQPSVTVRGRLIFEPGTTPPAQMRLINATPASGDPSLGEAHGSVRKASDGFEFELTGLLGGSYLLNLSWIGRFGVMSVMADGQDVTATGFDGTLGRDIDNAVITLTSRQPVISGVVRDDAGPARAAIIAFPQDSARWKNFSWEPLWLKTAGASLEGVYKLDSLPAGDYFVVAVPSRLREEFVNPEFLAKAATVATRVSVDWGQTRTVDLRIVEVK
jgi:hypothetical protein